MAHKSRKKKKPQKTPALFPPRGYDAPGPAASPCPTSAAETALNRRHLCSLIQSLLFINLTAQSYLTEYRSEQHIYTYIYIIHIHNTYIYVYILYIHIYIYTILTYITYVWSALLLVLLLLLHIETYNTYRRY